jgi:hypothetical protein
VQRAGKTVKLTVPLETAPDTGRDEIVLTARSPFQGAKVANISPAVADELRLDRRHRGRRGDRPRRGGTAASVGFQKGDIILAVNNQKIAKTSDLEKASKRGRGCGASSWCAAASRSTSRSADEPEATQRGCQPVRRRRDGAGRAASAAGPVASRARCRRSSDRIISSGPTAR